MRRLAAFTAVVMLVFGAVRLSSPLRAAAADAPAQVKAILEVDREAYYGGDAVPVRISIWNDGSSAVEVPGGDIQAGFELYDSDGKTIALSTGAASAAPAAPPASPPAAKSLAPGAFFGFARDLTTIYPRLKEPGTYRLQWASAPLTSNAVILRIVPRYDPEKEYTARVETDLGAFTLEFLRKDAPIAVKTFIELAQTGFYDGVIFHFVEPGRMVVSGDPTGTGDGGPGFGIPHERPRVKMLAGTVIMRATGRPPTNGSIFAILLEPCPDCEGNATGFAQVVDGLDVVRKISEVPASPKTAPAPYRPLKDVRINRVIVKTKTS